MFTCTFAGVHCLPLAEEIAAGNARYPPHQWNTAAMTTRRTRDHATGAVAEEEVLVSGLAYLEGTELPLIATHKAGSENVTFVHADGRSVQLFDDRCVKEHARARRVGADGVVAAAAAAAPTRRRGPCWWRCWCRGSPSTVVAELLAAVVAEAGADTRGGLAAGNGALQPELAAALPPTLGYGPTGLYFGPVENFAGRWSW